MSVLDNIVLVSNSKLDTWKECEVKYYLSYEKAYRPHGTSPALAFGSAWGAAMDTMWAVGSSNPDAPNETVAGLAHEAFLSSWIERDMPMGQDLQALILEGSRQWQARNPAIAETMLINYATRRLPVIRKMELLEVEKPFAVPIDSDNPRLFYVGKMDKVYRDKTQGGVYGIDHKTSSAYRVGGPFQYGFLNSFSPNSQMDGYLYYLRYKYGTEARYIYIDAALVHKTHHAAFEMLPVHRTLEQLNKWLQDTVEYTKRIARAHEQDVFLANTRSCHNYTGCQYLDICKAVADPRTMKEPMDGFFVSNETTAERLGIDLEALEQVVQEAQSNGV